MNTRNRIAPLGLIVLSTAVLTVGCGTGGAETEPAKTVSINEAISKASAVDVADFPEAKGKSLQEIADLSDPGPELGAATATFQPGDARFAFGLIDANGSFVYAPTVVYFAEDPSKPATGPFPALPRSLVVEPPYRSAGAAEGDAISAIYSAELPFEKAGEYEVLALTQLPQGLFGTTAVADVHEDSTVPAVGQEAPSAKTDTLASAGGDIKAIDTRVPNDDMHDVGLDEVLGSKPVALLFATPQLCQSRVCGPVTDILQQLKADYGDRVAFIHQEVYEENDPDKGFRESLETYGLPTEPWLFVIDADGKVTARLEGSFGVDEVREAIETGL